MNSDFFYKTLVRTRVLESDIGPDLPVEESLALVGHLYAYCAEAIERGTLSQANMDPLLQDMIQRWSDDRAKEQELMNLL